MMKRYIIIVLSCLSFVACEDVVEVELNESEPKLVIDAKLTKDLATETSEVFVKLSTTAPFFDNVIPAVTDAIVFVSSESGTSQLTHIGAGFYTADIIVQENEMYTLEVTYNNETFLATEKLEPVVPLEFVEQRDDGGFSGDEIELKAFFTDPEGIENYYFFEGLSDRGNVYDTFNDEFFDGNSIFGFYQVEDLAPEDEITFFLSGVDEQFYNFMFILLQQGSDDSGGPFETQPATVRGNIINTTNPDNFPLGYFRVSQVSSLSYTVQ